MNLLFIPFSLLTFPLLTASFVIILIALLKLIFKYEGEANELS